MTEPTPPVEDVWDRFHEVVNMTSQELVSWLGVTEDLKAAPGPAQPPPLGVAVVEILRKRKTDLTDADVETMTKVVEVVEDETEGLSSAEIGNDERRRRRLLNVGHDPLRAG
jgi:hypothetical protein